ncbi:MAG TPA: M14 family metallopeptidase [Chloroflexia bacterium]|nr:M14 family metallopeptidase [Chloroflexia bacterium]
MAAPAFDFSHYFTYDELTGFLNGLAAEYPHLIAVETIGKSHEGRDIPIALVTNHATGPALEKPGYWIDANTHAGEVTGSAVALYTIHHLLTQYGEDPQVTRLLDEHTMYILPRITVDGSEKYLTTPHMLRSSVRAYPYEDERDGLHRDDVDGDGLILQMRIEDEAGAWKASEADPRVMRRREPDEFGGTYYTVLPEGRIRNYDGYEIKVAPQMEGLDFNRNYPHMWAPEGTQGGAGEYPFSEPETRAEAEFWRTHRNINGFLTYHTYSAVILRPYSTHSDDEFPPEDLDVYKMIGQKGTDLTGYECVSVFHKFRYHPKEVIHGGMDDYAYDQMGWFGFTTELWDVPAAAGVEKKEYIEWMRWHPEEDDLKIMQWNDEKLGGNGFHSWRPFDHPQLGAVEIGGWDVKSVWQNAPAEYLPELCEKHSRFTIAHALMSPRLGLRRLDITHQGGDVYRVIALLENRGFLPTYTSKKGLERKAVRPIRITLTLPEGATLVSGEAEQEVGHLEGRSSKAFGGFSFSGTDNRCKVEWVVRAPSGSKLHLAAHAERAGTVRADITLGE